MVLLMVLYVFFFNFYEFKKYFMEWFNVIKCNIIRKDKFIKIVVKLEFVV